MPPRHGRALDRITPWLVAAALSCGWLATGCGGDDDGPVTAPSDGGCEAVTDASLDCTPAFEPPDFSAIYDNVIEKRCGSSDMGCHGHDAGSGLEMTAPASAHAYLLGQVDDRARVVPGHPECSELVLRVQSSDPRVRMPWMSPTPLDDNAICAIRQWIANGAEGP